MDSLVALTSCQSYEEQDVKMAMDQVLSALGGLDFVKPGMKVGVKVNLLTARKPEGAATTHPALLMELGRRLTERGAEVIFGDSPGGVFSSAYVNTVYSACGLKELEKIPGCHLNQNFSEGDKSFPEGAKAHQIHYVTWVDDCDLLINFCKLKTHGMMGMSCACKNMFGMIPGTYKAEYHFRFSNTMDFARMLVDLNQAFPCVLNLVDGVVAMEGNGPSAGEPRPMGVLLASANPHALDTVCARIMHLSPEQIPTIVAAKEQGLIPEEVITSEPVEPYVAEDFKNIKNAARLLEQDGNTALFGKLNNQILTSIMGAKPKVEKEECVGCGKCASVCPAKAIEMKKGLPDIDRKACIRCFCCQEFCPKGAMKVHRPVIARVAGKL